MEESVGIGPAYILFSVLFLSTFSFLVIWVIGVVVRLRFPERMAPAGSLSSEVHRRLVSKGSAVPVGLETIRKEARLRSEVRRVEYEYDGIPRRRLPDAWLDDVAERCN